MKYYNKKISIIVPIYNSEKYLERCLDSLINQTYKNLEIILVNDASLGTAEEICQRYMEKDIRIKYLKHKKNKGLFQARLTGMSSATGDYVAFCDSDDYVSCDFYRELVFKAVETSADIVIGETIIQRSDESKFIFNLHSVGFKDSENEDCLKDFFEQEGFNFSWHTAWNKIYSRDIIESALPFYRKQNVHLNMCEDVAISTVLFGYARRIRFAKNVGYFYCQNSNTLTDPSTRSLDKFKKNIQDLILAFNIVEKFLKENKLYDTYGKEFISWKNTYNRSWTQAIESSMLTQEEKIIAFKSLSKFISSKKPMDSDDNYFSSLYTEWNDNFDNLKKLIIDKKIKCVSFDIFDTLICRAFLNPTDLFVMMNEFFHELIGNRVLLEFSDIREECEIEARLHSNSQEITLYEIYELIRNKYSLSQTVIDKLMEKEVEYELSFSMPRESIQEIYQMCIYLGKKVIFVSDNYLSESIITKLLKKNKYEVHDNLYVSSETKSTKETGDLFKHVSQNIKISPNEILHIGDNYQSDYEMARKSGWNSFYYPKCKDVFFGISSSQTNKCGSIFSNRLRMSEDNICGLNFIGIRTMLALVAKKYFDNPFVTFNSESDFNGDPYFMGYYILGMYTFSITNWLIRELENEKTKKIAFMARDGYLFKKIFDIIAPAMNTSTITDYLYMSRKALVPFLINNQLDWYKLYYSFRDLQHTGSQMIEFLQFALDTRKLEKLRKVCFEKGIDIDKKFENRDQFDSFIGILQKNFYDEKKYTNFINIAKKYFKNILTEGSAIFDVGYSGKPEFVLSKICERSFDTYFLNINSDEALRNAQAGDFKLKTFFNYKPTITGLLSEYLVSELSPSCVSYKVSDNNLIPIFEDKRFTYQEHFIIDKIQTGAIDFVKDLVDIFGSQVKQLYYQDFYACLPYDTLIYSARDFDKAVFQPLNFEDDLGGLKVFKLVDYWNNELRNVGALSSFDHGKSVANGLDLSKKSRFMRFVYYCLFDRQKLKSIFSTKIKNKYILKASRIAYHMLKRAKKGFWVVTHIRNSIKSSR